MTLEAVALHYLDNLDAKIFAFGKAIEESTVGDAENWTEYNKMFDGYLWKGPGSGPGHGE
jgi:3'-5' exoribonuclease